MIAAHAIASSVDAIRPTRVVVSLDQLARNLTEIRARVGSVPVMPVVKSNAYGHGLIDVARHLERAGADALAVACVDEGIALRRGGVSLPVLVLSSNPIEQLEAALAEGLMPTLCSVDDLRRADVIAASLGRPARAHLKIDTGMGRLGAPVEQAVALIEASQGLRNLEIDGIYSHLANADATDLEHARRQLAKLRWLRQFVLDRRITGRWHIAASGALLQLPEADLDLVRPGILLYGVYPSTQVAKNIDVCPVMTWQTRVSYVKEVSRGTSVGYGSTWCAPRTTRLATLPVGYGDGYARSMSGRAHVLIRGVRCPVVGRISMDQIVVDLGRVTCRVGEQAILVGRSGDEVVRWEDLARWSQTIPYEVFTRISARVPRMYIRGGT